ncbi:MAG: hypothetical protein ABJC74_16215, partial [Gemmatimonadota bacterium]
LLYGPAMDMSMDETIIRHFMNAERRSAHKSHPREQPGEADHFPFSVAASLPSSARRLAAGFLAMTAQSREPRASTSVPSA